MLPLCLFSLCHWALPLKFTESEYPQVVLSSSMWWLTGSYISLISLKTLQVILYHSSCSFPFFPGSLLFKKSAQSNLRKDTHYSLLFTKGLTSCPVCIRPLINTCWHWSNPFLHSESPTPRNKGKLYKFQWTKIFSCREQSCLQWLLQCTSPEVALHTWS